MILVFLFILLPTIFGSDNNNGDIYRFFSELSDINRGISKINYVDNGVSKQCEDDFKLYKKRLLQDDWARRMFDSSAKIPESIEKGNTIIMGQFDECIDIDGPNNSFTGQHCMLDLNIYINKIKFPEKFFYGECVPSSCSTKDVEKIYNSWDFHNNLISLNLSVSIIPDNCRTRDSKPLRAGDWVVVGVLIVFVIIAITSTAYDVYQRFKLNNEKPNPLYSAFSWYSNGKSLLEINRNTDQMLALYGLRAITIGWVILGHAYLNSAFSPIVNPVKIVEVAKDWSHVVIANAFVSVDTFFLMSGMLVCFVFFRNIGSKRTYDAPVNYIHRYIRLTPSYAAMILLEVTILNYIGDGPMWYRIHNQSTKNCEDWWWTSILYVQNYVNPINICLTQTWYLSADMQMFWLAPILLYPLYLWPVVGGILMCTILMASCWASFAVTYVFDLPPSFILHPNDDRMAMEYYPMHTRLPPYLVGIALGYLICGIRAKKISVKLSPTWITIGWILSTLLMIGSFNTMTYFTQLENGKPTYTSLEAAFYLGFHRLGWSLGLAWIIFACVNGFGGIVNAILSFSILQPLAKLSYGAYIIHYSLQRYRIGMLRTSVYGADLDMVYYFIADYIVANLLSIPMFMIFEQPFLHIDRYFLGKIKIFPFPKPKARPTKEVKSQETLKKTEEDVEKGNANEAFQPTEEEVKIS